MTTTVSLQNTLSRHIRLLDVLQTYGPLPSETEVRQRGGKFEPIQQEALKAIALLLVVEPEDHVVVTEVKGPRLVIAKARPIDEKDRVRAIAVVDILREIRFQTSTESRGVLSAVTKQEFGHALFQQQIGHLQAFVSQPVTELTSAVKDLYPDSLVETRQFSEAVAKFMTCVTGRGLTKMWDLADCEGIVKLARALVRHKFVHESGSEDSPLYSIFKPLRSFVQWTGHFSSLTEYVKTRDMNALDYRFIPTTSTHITVKWNLLSTMEKIIDSLPLSSKYDAAKIHLKKLYTQVQDDEMDSQFTCAIHPEMQIALDKEMSGTLTRGTHLIVGNVNPCLCCLLWIRLYNKHHNHTLWICGDNYRDIGVDWAAPDRSGLTVSTVNEELLGEIKGFLSKFLCNQLETIESYSSLELEQSMDDEEGQTEEEDELSPLD